MVCRIYFNFSLLGGMWIFEDTGHSTSTSSPHNICTCMYVPGTTVVNELQIFHVTYTHTYMYIHTGTLLHDIHCHCHTGTGTRVVHVHVM